MDVKCLSQLSDERLLQATAALVRQGHVHTATLVAHLAEVLSRRAYVPAGHSSLYRYCVHELHLSESSAYKHIWGARMARRFSGVLDAIAEGRVHLAGLRELARYMTHANAAELLAGASHRTRSEIVAMLANRFPAPDLPTRIVPLIAGPTPATQTVALAVESGGVANPPAPGDAECVPGSELSPGTVVPGQQPDSSCCMVPVATPVSPFPRVVPLSPGRFALQVTIDRRTHDLLKRAQELLAHAQPGCEVSQVLERALLELVQRLEHRKHGATDTPRVRRASLDTRYIPAEIKRQVSERDRRRCTFVSTQGRRCEERSMLEYDHALPVARGGRSTVENLRLRCRAHNQYEAECAYGAGFMHAKRPVVGPGGPTGFEPDPGARSPHAGPSAATLHDAPTVEGFRPAVR
jgi:hypothetical protein